jgi:hypothetical protein
MSRSSLHSTFPTTLASSAPPQRAAGLAIALLIAGCGGGGGSGGAAGSGSVQPGSTAIASSGNPGSATNRPQWQMALAALGSAPAPTPVALPQDALLIYNDLVARTWPHILPLANQALVPALQGLVGATTGDIRVLDIHGVRLDASAPPALAAAGPPGQPTVEVRLPAPPGAWRLDLTAEVGGDVRFHLFGVLQTVRVQAAVEVTARDIRVSEQATLDLADPVRPRLSSIGTPSLDMRLELRSPDPIVSTVLGALQPVLDPIVRVALLVGAGVARDQLGIALAAVPMGAPWGAGGPPPAAMAPPAPLEALAIGVGDELARNHTPFDQVLVAVFDTPHQGGQVLGWRHHGDSALWTGNALGAECFRHDLTGDPRSLALVERLVSGIGVMLEVSPTQDGLLARTAVPLTSPHVAPLMGSREFFVGQARGQSWGGIEAVSRDSYTGVMFGLTQAHHRVPAVRAEAGRLIERAVHYLETHDWIAHRVDGVSVSVMFFQSPVQVVAMTRSAATVNPARWGVVADRYAALTGLFWLPDWASARDVHEAYFKFNLGHLNATTLLTLETDPQRYRDTVATLRVLRDTVAHHRNAWFDTVWAMAVPPESGSVAPVVEDGLRRWALRPRRGFTVQNSLDPTVQTTTVTLTTPNHSGSPTSPPQLGPRTYEVAVYPLPVEKRWPGSYVWSESPFDLDGAEDPHEQHQGVDLVLPYWVARSHGVIR